ncbi:MAG: hypothetical protein IT196_21920, partial [Acidimicrobiales bacterium]|nr:hypothetical protein [Acidimicrobiales bacterium]
MRDRSKPKTSWSCSRSVVAAAVAIVGLSCCSSTEAAREAGGCAPSGAAVGSDLPDDLRLTTAIDLPRSEFPPSPAIALYRRGDGVELAIMDYGAVSPAEALPGRTDGIAPQPLAGGGASYQLGPAGPHGIEGVLVDQPGRLRVVLSRQLGQLSDWDGLLDSLEQGEGPYRRVSFQAASHVPGIGVLPISPAADGTMVSYTARDEQDDQRVVVMARVSTCDDAEPLGVFTWWYGPDIATIDGARVASSPAPAGNGTFVLRFSLGDGLTVVGTIGLTDDESA